MRVTRLKLTNLRAIQAAEFHFQSGLNLIVGVNGVGKTSVLDALAVSLSSVVKHTNSLQTRATAFDDHDVREGARSLTAECAIRLEGTDYTYLIHKSLSSNEQRTAKSGMPREEAIDTPDRSEFIGDAPQPLETWPSGRPFGVLFSTQRATPSEKNPSKGAASGGVNTAYADAFEHRDLQLGEFALWLNAQETLKKEIPAIERVLEALEKALRRFLPGYMNLRVNNDDPPRLTIDLGEKTTLSVEALSDTERARLQEALTRRDTWMDLNWKADPKWSPEQASRAFDEQRNSILDEMLKELLPNCERFRSGDDGRGQVIDRKPTTIEVSQLSDGERGTLALVLDLTKRLTQANPELADPAAEAESIVLIDEIELHLHPKWQRQIVDNLVTTFPRCQFIVTTHSPQVIGEVEHDQIQIIADGIVYSPSHSFGMDSSQVLEEIMQADPRTQEVKDLLARISGDIGQQQYDRARRALSTLTELLGNDDPEVTRIQTLLDFVEGNE